MSLQRVRSGSLSAVGLGTDQIHDCFRLRQIDATVQKGPFREFARFRKPGPVIQTAGQNVARREKATMAVNLHDIFCCETARGAHDGKHYLVKEIPVVAYRAVMNGVRLELRRLAAWRNKDCVRYFKGLRPRNPNDGDAAFSDRESRSPQLCLP